ncbi:MAG: hypothetical protein JXB88_26165 [Spirochaetales bacterium]|nr:hypothetical protein [Spirochaetales bacterium]
MSGILLCVILFLVLGNVIQYLVGKRRKKLLQVEKERSVQLANAVDKLAKRAERLQKVIDGNLKAEEEAENEEKELENTGDSDLVDRANDLFDNLQNDK